ncbi:MAG: hypothetical protein KF744_18135 [Taibaiella sp.]|nr:hypothetical protein [Taibaiella sp.]
MGKTESLKQQTKENVEGRKDFSPAIPGKFRSVENYHSKYLRKSVEPFSVPTEFVAAEGRVKPLQVRFDNAPIPNRNVLLAMAFSKAQKLFSSLINSSTKGKKNTGGSTESLFSYLTAPIDEEVSSLSPFEALSIISQLSVSRSEALEKSLKQCDRRYINEFAVLIPLIYKTLDELRNYHAHVFHEPGPIRFQDIYGAARPAKKHSKAEWEAARQWFETRMDDVRNHLSKSLQRQLAERKLSPMEREDTERVLSTIEGYSFEKDGHLTQDALLFIACMFLRRSDAEYFVKKWTRGVKAEGVFKTLTTFFTFYSIRDKKSLQSVNADMLKFRKIIGQLSTMPEFSNECFGPVNKYLHDHNNRYGEQASDKDAEKKHRDEAGAFCIPLRKSFNPAYWYIDYLKSKGYLDAFSIARYKTEEDRLAYLDENNVTGDMLELKLWAKQATGDEKKHLRSVYNNAKRNFYFKPANDANTNYCIKNSNCLFRLERQDGIPPIQFALSEDMLMKWVFADIFGSKGKEIANRLKGRLLGRYHALLNGNYNSIPLNELPPSVASAVEQPMLKFSLKKAEAVINTRKQQLLAFCELNRSKKAPWKFAAKRKIDIIFDFVHLAYTFNAVNPDKPVDDRNEINKRRHAALNDFEYLDALEYIRHYGRYYGQQEFRRFFFEEKREYSNSLRASIEQSTSLEELFNNVVSELNRLYDSIFKKLQKDVSGKQLEKFIRIFKPAMPSKLADREQNAKLFATNQVVTHDFISIKDLLNGTKEYEEWHNNLKQKNKRTSDDASADFSLMRFILTKESPFDTNTDFLMKIILPEVMHALPKNDSGTIKGNSTLFAVLMKNKIDELMLWEVAKSYWKSATGNDFTSARTPLLRLGSDKVKATPYKKRLFFYTLFDKELPVKLSKPGAEDTITVMIRAKKFDDELQYYESEELYAYIKAFNPLKLKGEDGRWHFESLNKEMKNVLARYLDDAYLLLTIEKKAVQENFDLLAARLEEKATSSKWDGYYYPFGRIDKSNDDDNLIAEKIYQLVNPSGEGYSVDDLITYRNKVFHQQIHPSESIYQKVKKNLVVYFINSEIVANS